MTSSAPFFLRNYRRGRLRSVPLRQSERAIKRPKRNLPSVPVESLRSRAYKASGLAGFHPGSGTRTNEGFNLRRLKNTVSHQVARENEQRARAMNARREEAARRIQRLWRAGTTKPGLKGRVLNRNWAYNPAMIRQMNAWTKALNNFNTKIAGSQLEHWYRTDPEIRQIRSNLRNRRLTNVTGRLVEVLYPKKNKYTFMNVVHVLGLSDDPRLRGVSSS